MTQKAALELPEDVVREHNLGECFSFSPAGLSCNFDSLGAENATASETVDPTAAGLLEPTRFRPSDHPSARHLTVWLTSLHKPGVFEVAPTENVSGLGMQMVTQKFWEPAEQVLVSSPPGFCVQGSVVYCKKLPSDDYILGVRLDAPVGHWVETPKTRRVLTNLNPCPFRISNETNPGVPSPLPDQG